MAKSSLFTVFILLGLCSFAVSANLSKDLELQLHYNIFKDWISKFNKQYGVEELAIRFMNWKTNFDLVQEHNSKDLSWKLAMNHFGDLSTEEFSALHLGLNTDLVAKKKNNSDKKADSKNHTEPVNNHTKSNSTEEKKKNTPTTLPKSVDWRKEGAVTGVKNQGQCGGCWAFSASGALEGLHAIKSKKLMSFSEQQMIDCAGSFGNQGCDGGMMTSAFEYTHDHGIEPESGYGYTASTGDCNANTKKAVFKNTWYKEVEANNHLALKHAVAQQPVSIGIEASSMTIQLFKSGIISSGCGTQLDHGVLAVGYGAAKNGQEYWIVKNSWGPEWGLDGYMNIAMGSQNDGAGVCGINMMASYPTL